MLKNKIKIALTYAPSEQQFLPVPPLGISVLSQHLKNNMIDNDIIDLELELWIKQNYKSSIYAAKKVEELDVEELPIEPLIEVLVKYDVVTFSMMGKRQLPYVIAIAKHLKRISPKVKIVLGGAYFNQENSKNIILSMKRLIDYIIVGEGWLPLTKLLSLIMQHEEIKNIPGVVYCKNNNSICYTEAEKWEGDLPIPNYIDINHEGYIKQQNILYGFEDDRIIYHVLVGDRHCPYRCSFCRISENTKKVKSPLEIAEEMIELNKVCGAQCFSLVCNEMNPTEQYFHEFLDRLIKYEKKLYWFCYLRPNKLSINTLQKAKMAGCVLIRYGVETGSQKIINHMNKILYVDEMKEIMRNTSKAGIWNHINIVTGYLHENDEDVRLTLEFLEENKNYIDSVRVNPFYIPVNSPIHLNPEKYGIRLRNNTGSYIQFDEQDKTWEEKQEWIKNTTEVVLKKCIDLDINFAGILPFLVAIAVVHFGDVEKTKGWIKDKHNYLCKPISPDTAKWRLAHPEQGDIEINKWDEIAGKRGSNYQTLVEMNDDFEEDSY